VTCRRHSCRNAASRASRVWAASALAVLAAGASIFADVVHLKGGRIVEAGECRREGQEIRCSRAGGVIGFPFDQVERIEKTARATPRHVVSPAPVSVPVERRAAPLEPVLDTPSGELTPSKARARIDELSAAKGAGAPGDDRHKELAALYAYLGNTEMLAHNYDGAVALYQDSLDNDPRLTVARLNLCSALLNLNRQPAAEEIARAVLAEQPDNPRAMEMLGEAALRSGRPDEAIELWQKSLALKPSDGLRARLDRARRLGQAEEGFRSSEGARFSLKFDGEQATPELAEEILGYLDASYSELSRRFSHYPEGVIRVTLYSRKAFQLATESPDWVGGLFDGQMRVPIGGLSRLTPAVKRVLIHELTHCFVASRSRGNAPRWLQEGIAQVVEGRATTAAGREALRQAYEVLGGPKGAMEFSYPRALSQMEFFFDTWSDSHFNDLLDQLARGIDIEDAMRAVTGVSYTEFLKAWGASLER